MSQPTPDERAADWLIRRDRGLTPGEQDDYLQWLAADPRHASRLAGLRADLDAWRKQQGDTQTVFGRPLRLGEPVTMIASPGAKKK